MGRYRAKYDMVVKPDSFRARTEELKEGTLVRVIGVIAINEPYVQVKKEDGIGYEIPLDVFNFSFESDLILL